MGALYLASKLEECPIRMRDLINVYDLLLQRTAHKLKHPSSSTTSTSDFKYVPMSYFGNTFYDLKDALVVGEMQILKRLGFNVHVVLPYGTLVNYLRLLGLTEREDVSSRAWGYLNDARVSSPPHLSRTVVHIDVFFSTPPHPGYCSGSVDIQVANTRIRAVCGPHNRQRRHLARHATSGHPAPVLPGQLLVGTLRR